MPTERPKVILDILEEHFEELGFLWARRLSALDSPVMTLRDLRDLEERIEAHVEGLLVGEDDSCEFLKTRLPGTTREEAFAAVFPLLRLGKKPATDAIWECFLVTEGDVLRGFVDALSAVCPPAVRPGLLALAKEAPSLRSSATVEVLAACAPEMVRSEVILPLLRCDSAPIRLAGWRTVAKANVALARDAYEGGLVDRDARVRKECLWAAAGTAQPWVLDYCRAHARKPLPKDPFPMEMLAILGAPTDLALMLEIGQTKAYGPDRFKWLGSYGNPKTIDLILAGFSSVDHREAIAAGDAFMRITGVDVSSQKRVQLPPEDGSQPDEFESEFLEEGFLPDSEKARSGTAERQNEYREGSRMVRGWLDEQVVSVPDPIWIDMQSSNSRRVRARFPLLGGNFQLESKPTSKTP